MNDWGNLRRRRRVKQGSFDPDSEYISRAVREYRGQGGRITVLPSPGTTSNGFDFNIEAEAGESLNSRGIYD